MRIAKSRFKLDEIIEMAAKGIGRIAFPDGQWMRRAEEHRADVIVHQYQCRDMPNGLIEMAPGTHDIRRPRAHQPRGHVLGSGVRRESRIPTRFVADAFP